MLGYHLTLSAYGFWLPNDPRGSRSKRVGAFNLRPFGEATNVNTQHSRASERHDVKRRLAAKQALAHEPVQFTGEQARAIALGFYHAAYESNYVFWALAVMKDHVHVAMAAHEKPAEVICRHLKARATRMLNQQKLNPLKARSPWSRGAWHVYLDTTEQVARCIEYVENNPVKAGLPRQRWSFVQAFEGS